VRTLNHWKDAHPEFLHSLKQGKEVADAQVEKSLYERALGYSHPEVKVFNNAGEIITYEVTKHYPPDPTSMIFWLKNRRPEQWRDKQEHDHNHHGAVAVDTNRFSEEVMREIMQRARDQRETSKVH
jgi:hypothetical protein